MALFCITINKQEVLLMILWNSDSRISISWTSMKKWHSLHFDKKLKVFPIVIPSLKSIIVLLNTCYSSYWTHFSSVFVLCLEVNHDNHLPRLRLFFHVSSRFNLYSYVMLFKVVYKRLYCLYIRLEIIVFSMNTLLYYCNVYQNEYY